MGWPRNLVLVRHAESERSRLTDDRSHVFEPTTRDLVLTVKGRKQAEITGGWLRTAFPEGFDVHYASYYVRSQQTMGIMFPNFGIREDSRLIEAQRGIYSFLTQDELQREFPLELARYAREGVYHHRPLGGENWADVELRIHSFLGTLNRDCESKDVVVVAHREWLLLFQHVIHHRSIEETMQRYARSAFDHASVTHYMRSAAGDKLQRVSENFVPWAGKV